LAAGAWAATERAQEPIRFHNGWNYFERGLARAALLTPGACAIVLHFDPVAAPGWTRQRA
jgi:hypothetical protein